MMTTKSTPRRFDARHTFQVERYSGAKSSTTYKSNKTWTDLRIGGENPRYKQQIAKGNQAATSMYGERTEILNAPGSITQFTNLKPGKSWSSSDITVKSNNGTINLPNALYSPGGLSESLANNRALERIVAKIRSKQTTFEGGVFFGELHQTIKLIANPARELRKRIDRYRDNIYRLRRDVRNFAKNKGEVVRRARDTWLTYQLGWAPLVSEVDSAMQAFAESNVLSDGTWETVRAIGIDEKVVQRGTKNSFTNAPYYTFATLRKEIVTVRYIASVDVGSYNAGGIRRMGIAPTNWLPTVWELIPYSFVIDYFSNIGNVIEAATLARSGVRWIVKTVRKEHRWDYINPRAVLNPATSKHTFSLGSSFPGKMSMVVRHVERVPYTGSLVPDIRFKLPGFKTQWTNVAALIHAKNELRSYYR